MRQVAGYTPAVAGPPEILAEAKIAPHLVVLLFCSIRIL
jgi:hypothetical protein